MNMIELPPLASKSRRNLIMRSVDDDKKEGLVVRMNGYLKASNFDSSASSTSRSHSSGGGLLVKRSKTSNNLSQDGRLGTLFEQSKTPPARRPQRTFSNQRLSNRSDYGSTTTGPSRSNMATVGSRSTPKRCVSSSDVTKMDKNNNRGNNDGVARGNLNRYKSEQKLSASKDDERDKKSEARVPDEAEDEDEKERRILDWLQNVEQFAEPPPEIPDEIAEDPGPPQTDTAIHIVYEGAR